MVLNPEATPGLTVTGGMQSSIFHEGELFMKNLLWSGPLSALLTSRQTWTSAADRDPDLRRRRADARWTRTASVWSTFRTIARACSRSRTFLLAGARSTGGSPVARGLAVNGSVVCDVNPPFPETDPEVTAAIAGLADKSELEKAAVPRGGAQVRQLSPAVRRLRHGARALRRRRALPHGGSRGPPDRRELDHHGAARSRSGARW